MADVKEKIKKLLALGTSPNEYEARDAILKARALMAEHKLSEADFENKEAKVCTIEADVKWTTDSGNIWLNKLCEMLCNKYCCAMAWYTPRHTRTHILYITGLEDDVQVCKEVVEYAVGFVLNEIKIMQRRRKEDSRTIANSYAEGFILGLEFALEEQDEEHKEWGLVISKPQEVLDYENQLSKKSVRTKKVELDPLAFLRGRNDGENFSPKKILKG